MKFRRKLIAFFLPLSIIPLIAVQLLFLLVSTRNLECLAFDFQNYVMNSILSQCREEQKFLKEISPAYMKFYIQTSQNKVFAYLDDIHIKGGSIFVLSGDKLLYSQDEFITKAYQLEGLWHENPALLSLSNRKYLVRLNHEEIWDWIIMIRTDKRILFRDIYRLTWGSIVVVVILAILVFIYTLLFTTSISRPLMDLNEAMEEYTQTGQKKELVFSADDEFNTILNNFNLMVKKREEARREQEELQKKFSQIQKMDAIGQLAGGVAHDFNNMMGGIMGAAEMVKNSGRLDTQNEKMIDLILQTVNNAAELTAKMLLFSRSKENVSIPVDLHATLNDMIILLKRTIDKRIKVKRDFEAENSIIKGDVSGIQNMFLNLGINASQAIKEEGEIRLHTANVYIDEAEAQANPFEIAPGEYIEIQFSDTGSGIPEEHLGKIFEPFFTTKERGKGTGLGLAMVFGLVKSHNGSVSVYSEKGIGTTFHIYLPCSSQKIDRKETENDMEEGSGHILLIDDEEVIRATGKMILENLGYEVTVAPDGPAGLDLYNGKRKFDLVITDMIMPEMNGTEVFHRLMKIDKKAKVILSSGFTRPECVADLKAKGLKGFIKKPFKMAEFSHLVKKVIKS